MSLFRRKYDIGSGSLALRRTIPNTLNRLTIVGYAAMTFLTLSHELEARLDFPNMQEHRGLNAPGVGGDDKRGQLTSIMMKI